MNSEQAFEIIQEFKNVPRGTFLELENYVALLLKWNQKINLIGRSTEEDIWQRHILDSAQLLKFIPSSANNLIDVGTGAGLPGIILKILGFPKITLVESDQKKSVFLIEALRATKINDAVVINDRIENIPDTKFDIITCRALASINEILSLTFKFNKNESLNLFLKGSNVRSELDEALIKWSFDYELHPSITNKDGFIVAIKNLRAKHESILSNNCSN